MSWFWVVGLLAVTSAVVWAMVRIGRAADEATERGDVKRG